MKPELELGINNLPGASFKAFRRYQSAFQSHWHYHPELELVFFAQGKGVRFIGDDISLYAEGDLFLIGENLPHTFVSYDDESIPMVEAFCIQFPRTIFADLVECASLNHFFDEAKRGIKFTNPGHEVAAQLKRILSVPGIKALVALIELLDFLHVSIDHEPILHQAYQRHAVFSERHTRIHTAIDFINTHYHRPIPLQEIAAECHFSANAFCRWFKQQMDTTFIDYLNKVRLTHVCQLLIATDLTVGQIALQTGFETISTLNRLFQAQLHTSPGRFRAQPGLVRDTRLL